MKLSRTRRPLPSGIVFITAVALLCFAAGCATPIGVNHVDRTVALSFVHRQCDIGREGELFFGARADQF
jgi:hypothetical protein